MRRNDGREELELRARSKVRVSCRPRSIALPIVRSPHRIDRPADRGEASEQKPSRAVGVCEGRDDDREERGLRLARRVG